ncbi:hypothetical protein [Demequina salsinemoris]|uniref:hypothetical protein n=1 Tax=Demequina salsinemoris TaxID=577470 RepID=UPI00078579DD|nr:hypothetical protein [Demequina salsinemoris]
MTIDTPTSTGQAQAARRALPRASDLPADVCVVRGGEAVAGLGVSVIALAGRTPRDVPASASATLAALVDAERLHRAGLTDAGDALAAHAYRSSTAIDDAMVDVVDACVGDLPRRLVVIEPAGRPRATSGVTLLNMDLYRRAARTVEEIADGNAMATAAAAQGLAEIADEIRSWCFIEGLRAATRDDATPLELSVLAEHPDLEVRRAVAMNPRTSEADQALLAHDPEPRVRDAAWLHACCVDGDGMNPLA